MSLASFSPHVAKTVPPLRGMSSSDGARYSYAPLRIGQGTMSSFIGHPQSIPLHPPPITHLAHHTEHPEHPSSSTPTPKHLYVLPVLLLEFLALSLTRAVLPRLLLEQYGATTYLVLGGADCIRGFLAFGASPWFGKVSDQWGRRICLLVTVLGTCAPVCTLAFFDWKQTNANENENSNDIMNLQILDSSPEGSSSKSHASRMDIPLELPPNAIPLFVILLSLSGVFSSTFTLVFAYISDCISRPEQKQERVAAYGMALATFGLSFTMGPLFGGYLAQRRINWVFRSSLVLTILDLLYIWFVLPESKQDTLWNSPNQDNMTTVSQSSTQSVWIWIRQEWSDWNPVHAMELLKQDPFLKTVGKVALFYYTGLWAVISTLSLYAVQHFHLSTAELGELMSALGFCTMMAEAVLVRWLIPLWGETKAIKVGLLSFALQCMVLGIAHEKWHLFVCVLCSLLGNLVYPSLSSLVTATVEPKQVGESLGALNGVKALTEGVGPLVFGALMTVSEEQEYFPGWPYWIAAILVLMAYDVADKQLSPIYTKDDYIHELQGKRRRSQPQNYEDDDDDEDDDRIGCFSPKMSSSLSSLGDRDHGKDEEYQDLLPLSDVDEGNPLEDQ